MKTLTIDIVNQNKDIEENIRKIIKHIDESYPEIFCDLRDLIHLIVKRSYRLGLLSCDQAYNILAIEITSKKIVYRMLNGYEN
jgi:hypothetical protein